MDHFIELYLLFKIQFKGFTEGKRGGGVHPAILRRGSQNSLFTEGFQGSSMVLGEVGSTAGGILPHGDLKGLG